MKIKRGHKGASKIIETIIILLIIAALILVLARFGKDAVSNIYHLADLPWGAGE